MSRSFRKSPAGAGKTKGNKSSKILCNRLFRRIERQLMKMERYEYLPYRRIEILDPWEMRYDCKLWFGWSYITDPYEKKMILGK